MILIRGDFYRLFLLNDYPELIHFYRLPPKHGNALKKYSVIIRVFVAFLKILLILQEIVLIPDGHFLLLQYNFRDII